MNASVQLVTAPWSGVPWSPGASAHGVMGGGAPTPVWHGSGFNWSSMVGSRAGGPVATFLPNARGVPMTLSYVRRYPGGMRGLGQVVMPCIDDPTLDCSDPATLGVSTGPGNVTGSPSGISAALAQIFTPIAKSAGAIGQQYMAYQNPLYQKQTVALTPQGQVVYATNQPTSAAGIFGPSASGVGSLLPILLIGGVVLLMVVGKR